MYTDICMYLYTNLVSRIATKINLNLEREWEKDTLNAIAFLN